MFAFNSAKIFGSAFDGSNQMELGEAVTGAATFYGLKVRLPRRDGRFSVHLGWTGTPTGTFTLWFSNLPNPGEADDSDWVQDTTWAPTNPAGSAGKSFVTTGNLAGEWVRVKYVNASGTGTLYGHLAVTA